MFVLHMNDMRFSNVENTVPVLRAETAEEIEAVLEREKTEGYRDGQWAKVYAQGGLLEWYNPPWGQCIQNVGTEDDWAENARKQFNEQIMELQAAT